MSVPGVAGDRLLTAAFDSFTRHGFRRTTMADVAAAAGMSRPSVYLRVANKDELLLAVGQALLASSLSSARAAAGSAGTAAECLHGVLAAKLDIILMLAARSEHAVELLAEHARLDPEPSAEYTRELEALIVGILSPPMTPRRARDAAGVLTHCVSGLEAEMANPRRARRQLKVLVELISAGLPPTTTS